MHRVTAQARLFIACLGAAAVLWTSGCGTGVQLLEESCQNVCAFVADCEGVSDAALITGCEASCIADGEANPSCDQAVRDLSDCLDIASCELWAGDPPACENAQSEVIDNCAGG